MLEFILIITLIATSLRPSVEIETWREEERIQESLDQSQHCHHCQSLLRRLLCLLKESKKFHQGLERRTISPGKMLNFSAKIQTIQLKISKYGSGEIACIENCMFVSTKNTKTPISRSKSN